MLDIGKAEGDPAYLFARVFFAFEAANQSVVVADGREIRVFDRRGMHLRTFGGRGPGPGEFTGEAVIRPVAPDTILAWDPAQRRMTWFTLTGEIAKELSLVGVSGLPYGAGPDPYFHQVHPNGSLVIRWWYPADGQGFTRDHASFVIAPAGSTSAHTMEGLPAGAVIRAGSQSAISAVYPMMADAWGLRMSPPSIVVADDPDGRWLLSVYNLDGTLTNSFRASVPRNRVTDDMADAARTRVLAQVQSPSRQFEDAVQRMPMPDSAPAVGGIGMNLIVDPSDRVWVKRWRGAWEAAAVDVYDVIDRSGQWLGWVQIPDDLGFLLSIGEDHILFRWTDTMNVPHVRRHRLRKTP